MTHGHMAVYHLAPSSTQGSPNLEELLVAPGLRLQDLGSASRPLGWPPPSASSWSPLWGRSLWAAAFFGLPKTAVPADAPREKRPTAVLVCAWNRDPYMTTPEHCNYGGKPNFMLLLKKQHVSNGCNMYLLRSPVKNHPKKGTSQKDASM